MVYFTILIVFILPIDLASNLKKTTTVFMEVISVFELFLLTDIVLRFRTTILDREGEEVFKCKPIARRYIKEGSFIVDLLSLITMSSIFNHISYYKYIMLTKLL